MFTRSLLFLLVSGFWSLASAAESRPNIILIMTDDQGFAPVGKHGHPWLRTPNMDALHEKSTRFTRFLVSPTCAPTRSAIMTGRHPLKNGVTHTILERERMTLDATILPQVLKTVGYTTGIFGKWHLGDEDPYQPRNRGFDEEFIHGGGGIGQAYKCSCADAPGNKYFNPVLRHNGKFVKTEGFCTDLFFEAATDWILQKTNGDSNARPFFAYITTNAPHSPFVAPPANTEHFKKLGFGAQEAGFYGMIENIDENIGRLMATLEERKLLENTLVIFMSDNGMTGGGSGNPNKPLGKQPDGTPMNFYNADMKGLKNSTDEGGVRVPFFVRWDGHFKPGRDIDTIAAHLDILPTLADLTGAKLPENQVEGRSLLPLLKDPKSPWKDRFLFTHIGRWPTGEDPDRSKFKNYAVRNQRYRFVAPDKLYDMEKDPSQTTNVAAAHPDIISSMTTAYEQFWSEARPLMVNEDAPMSKVQPFHADYYKQEKEEGIPLWKPIGLKQ